MGAKFSKWFCQQGEHQGSTSDRSPRAQLVADFLKIQLLRPGSLSIAQGSTAILVEFAGAAISHCPEFEVVSVDGTRLADVQTLEELNSPELRERYDAVTLAAQALGIGYSLETDATVWVEPVVTNARLVWKCRNWSIHPSDRIRVLHHLDEFGRSNLIDASRACRPAVDGIAVILALACQGLIELDIASEPLGPGTTVMRRRV